MKKMILRTLLLSSILIGMTAQANNDAMFENTNSKEWAETPANVKNALKNIKTMSGESSKDMMSTNWLKELNRSPSTYGLNSNDTAWIEGMLNANKGKQNWNPKTKVVINSKKEQPKPQIVASVKSDDKPVKIETTKVEVPKKEQVKKEITPSKQEVAKIIEENKAKKTKAISSPLPNPPVNFAKNEKPDLTPVNNNVVKSDSLIKISDALIKINQKEQNEARKENENLLLVLDETLRVEEINRLEILELQEKNKLTNGVLTLLKETEEPKKMSDDLENVSNIVKKSSDDLGLLASNLEDSEESEDLLITNDVVQLENNVKNEPKNVDVNVEVVKVENKETQKSELQDNKNSLDKLNEKVIENDNNEKTWDLNAKLELSFILICFGLLTFWFLSVLGFRRGGK